MEKALDTDCRRSLPVRKVVVGLDEPSASAWQLHERLSRLREAAHPVHQAYRIAAAMSGTQHDVSALRLDRRHPLLANQTKEYSHSLRGTDGAPGFSQAYGDRTCICAMRVPRVRVRVTEAV